MPIYMDRHDISGASATDVAKAHQQDLKIQEKFGCKGLTYWFDEERGSAFCLIEAPNKVAVKEMHDHAHGLVPHQIIEVENKVVEAFLGRIQDPKPVSDQEDSDLLIINDPAFRAIMAIEVENFELIEYLGTKAKAGKIQTAYLDLVNSSLKKYKGLKVEHVRDGFLLSFSSVLNTLHCALELMMGMREIVQRFDYDLKLKIGISAGVPVTENNSFFGDTVHLARQLCEIATGERILISSSVNEYIGNGEIPKFEESESQFVLGSEERFLQQLRAIIRKSISDPKLSIDVVSKAIGLSKSQLYRRMILLTGKPLNDFIKNTRLKYALKQVLRTQSTVSEVAYDSGFSSPSYFSKCFKNHFDISPSDLLGRS